VQNVGTNLYTTSSLTLRKDMGQTEIEISVFGGSGEFRRFSGRT
jgi:hypothetical protein